MLINLSRYSILISMLPFVAAVSADNSWIPAVNYYLLTAEKSVAPKIIGQKSLTFNEEQAFQLKAEHFVISDEDKKRHTIQIAAGNNYQVSNNIIQPATNFNGELIIPVRASDGVNLSDAFIANVKIQNVNNTAAPVVNRFEWVPSIVAVGHQAVFYWDIEKVSGCTALTAGPGSPSDRPSSGSSGPWIYAEPREHITKWYCTDLDGNRFPATGYLEAPLSVGASGVIPAPVVERFAWSPQYANVGEPVTFYWHILNVSGCTALTAGLGSPRERAPSGTSGPWIYAEARVHTTKWYCKDLAGRRFPATGYLEAPLSVGGSEIVPTPVVKQFAWTPQDVGLGEPTTFYWNVSNVFGCTALTAGQGSPSERAPSGTSGPWVYTEQLQHVTKWYCTDLAGRRFPATGYLEAPLNVGGAGVVVYLHTDVLGSVIAESDDKGNIIKTTEYKPFGESKDD